MTVLALYACFFSSSMLIFADPWCMYEHNGASYTGSANTTGNGSECLAWSDPAVPLYPAESFPDGDTGHNYCRNPKDRGGRARGPWCFVMTDSGVKFEYCKEIQLCDCPSGHFGDGCKKICRCRDEEDTCNHVFGSCRSGCAAGWTGIDCQRRCPSGHYGFNCDRRCLNCFKSRCDPETGRCLDGCWPGFEGNNCSQECPSGWYGRNCDDQCGNCSNGEPCHVITGHCFAGCTQGYVGNMCKKWCNKTDPYKRVCVRRCRNCGEEMQCNTSGRCVQVDDTKGCCDGSRQSNETPLRRCGTQNTKQCLACRQELETTFPRKYVMAAIGGACAVAVIITIIGCFVLKRTRDSAISQHEKDVLHEFYLENYRRMESLDVPDPPGTEPDKIYNLIEVQERVETAV